ncbi:hypothetical protein HPB49_012584 [Dermacentor silvarum]|uniref:Uncharacterized protein n=1 Tax=Dermacentor silvarum TaxID=543639 RepID=A0ACB8DZP1_DERSI|nr:hypothetical protein HPB49_012584 [Dermacentor silvarum]
MSRNYTLLRIELPSIPGYETLTWAMRNIARRNYNIFSRTARFVMGERDPQCARALALVYDRPNFVEFIQNKGRVGAAEAAAMISRATKTYDRLDEFMKMVGVVKHGVECFSRRDGKAQLVNLDEYWWLETGFSEVSFVVAVVKLGSSSRARSPGVGVAAAEAAAFLPRWPCWRWFNLRTHLYVLPASLLSHGIQFGALVSKF